MAHDEGEIRQQILIADLHALRHREGMGKPAFPPQGVGTPVLFGVNGGSLAALGGRAGRPSPHDFLLPQKYVCSHEEGEDHGDHAVHGEESGVEIGKIVWLDEGMFVEQEQRDSDNAGEREFAESEGGEQGDQQEQHDQVEGARDPESAGDAEVAGDGVESGVAVELEILAGVEDVEAGDPEGHGGSKNNDARVEGSANGNPGGGGRDAEGKTEHEVRPAGEALRVRVKEQDGKGGRGQPEREAIQLGRGENEDGAGDDDEGGDEGGREMAGGEGAGASAGIGGVDGGVGEAIEGHGGGAGGEHGDYDPEKLMGGGKARGGEHGSAKSERESEDGVLPLDHLESDAEAVEDRHGKIVKQFSVLSSQLLSAFCERSLSVGVLRKGARPVGDDWLDYGMLCKGFRDAVRAPDVLILRR